MNRIILRWRNQKMWNAVKRYKQTTSCIQETKNNNPVFHIKGFSIILLTILALFWFYTNTGYAVSTDGWLWPIPEHKKMSRGYYHVSDTDKHHGIDINAAYGSPVRATKDGYVIIIYTGCGKSYRNGGNYTSCSNETCSPMVYENRNANASSFTSYSGGFYTFSIEKDDGSTVSYKRCNSGYGIGMVIYHPDDDSVSAYAHLSSLNSELNLLEGIKTGATFVHQGDIIGFEGASGNAFGEHLHFEVGSSVGKWINNNPNSPSLGITSNNKTGLSTSNGYQYNKNGLSYIFNFGYALSISAENGSISGTYGVGTNNVSAGTNILLTATPNENYTFTKWIITGLTEMTSSANPTLSFTMPDNAVTVQAKFEIKPHSIVKKWIIQHEGSSQSNIRLSGQLNIDISLDQDIPIVQDCRLGVSTSTDLANGYWKWFDTPSANVSSIGGGLRFTHSLVLDNIGELISSSGIPLSLKPGVTYYYRWAATVNNDAFTSALGSFTPRTSASWTNLHTEDPSYGLFNAQVNWDKSLSMNEVGCFVSTDRNSVYAANSSSYSGCAKKNDTSISAMSSLATDTTYGTIVYYRGPSFGTISSFIAGTTYYYKFYAITSDGEETLSEIAEYTPGGTIEPSGPIIASVDRGENGTYFVGDNVTMSVNVNNYDYLALRIYRKPPNEEEYLYWAGGALESSSITRPSGSEGTYRCVFYVTIGGTIYESEEARWSVCKNAANVDRGENGTYFVGENVTMSINVNKYDYLAVRIYRTPPDEEEYLYWAAGALESASITRPSGSEGTYRCVFFTTVGGITYESEPVSWSVCKNAAMVDRGENGTYFIGENVTMSIGINKYDYLALRIYRTPPDEEEYLYWAGGALESASITRPSGSEGTYRCVFYTTVGGIIHESEPVSWSVCKNAAMVDRGENGTYYVGEKVTMSINVNKYDYLALKIYRTPPDEEEYLYWQGGGLESAEFSRSFSSEGTYRCVFYTTAGGIIHESEAASWSVCPIQLQAEVSGGAQSRHIVGENVTLSVNMPVFSSYKLDILRTPFDNDGNLLHDEEYSYWSGETASSQRTIRFADDGYYTCTFSITNDAGTFESPQIGWYIDPLQALQDKEIYSYYEPGEPVRIKMNITDFDVATLVMYRTPPGGIPDVNYDAYLYMNRSVNPNTYVTSFDEEGYYSCGFGAFDETGKYFASKWTAWYVQSTTHISYDLNGGTGEFENQFKYYNTPLYLTDAVPSHSELDFLGWAKEADAAEAEYQPGDEFTEEGDFTLYALWKHVHALTAYAKVDATCTETGTEAYWRCGKCGKLFSDADAENEIGAPAVIAAKGHAWGEARYEWKNEDSQVVAARVCGNNAGHTETETADVTEEIRYPTEDSAGMKICTAVFVNSAFTKQQKEIVILPALKDMSRLTLPGSLEKIDEEAFAGTLSQAVIIPDGCKEIGQRAFAGCPNLLYVRIPGSVVSVAENAFEGSDQVIVEYVND